MALLRCNNWDSESWALGVQEIRGDGEDINSNEGVEDEVFSLILSTYSGGLPQLQTFCVV